MKNRGYIVIALLLMIGLPLAGMMLSGRNLSLYLQFPPRTQHVNHAPFSWTAFLALTLIILAVILPFLFKIDRARSASVPRNVDGRTTRRVVPTFPWWGWASVVFCAIFWILAWTRFSLFAPLQLYTFTPPWIGYIVIVNALTFRRMGRCLMTHETSYFLALFALSAFFWWFFEYLNRFVQNWYYVGCDHFSPLQYFVMATLPFSTVLPAVLSTEEWLKSHPHCCAGLEQMLPLRSTKLTALIALLTSIIGLFGIGLFPSQLFPLLWVAPLLLISALHSLTGHQPFFPELEQGDWRRVFRLCLAALLCGFFWEMWNSLSLAKWIYTVPYVHRFQLFEMPILGYAGYLPFGLECAVIAALIKPHKQRNV
ncbi:MAG: hypothetical protein JXR23_10035 [Pontiellaceae bacterium]|nr:hypothetical protein [Pontiellaceae bacterium]